MFWPTKSLRSKGTAWSAYLNKLPLKILKNSNPHAFVRAFHKVLSVIQTIKSLLPRIDPSCNSVIPFLNLVKGFPSSRSMPLCHRSVPRYHAQTLCVLTVAQRVKFDQSKFPQTALCWLRSTSPADPRIRQYQHVLQPHGVPAILILFCQRIASAPNNLWADDQEATADIKIPSAIRSAADLIGSFARWA